MPRPARGLSTANVGPADGGKRTLLGATPGVSVNVRGYLRLAHGIPLGLLALVRVVFRGADRHRAAIHATTLGVVVAIRMFLPPWRNVRATFGGRDAQTINAAATTCRLGGGGTDGLSGGGTRADAARGGRHA